MQRTVFSTLGDLERARGSRVGESAWRTITQDVIDGFAEVTGDRQWIHVDSARAREESPLGTTIAHGFLTLALLPVMLAECISFPTARLSLNYGFERIRFVAPVPAEAQIRGVFTIDDVRSIDGGAQTTWAVEVELRDSPKPALAARWLTRVLFGEPDEMER